MIIDGSGTIRSLSIWPNKLSKTQLKVLQSINPGEEVTSEQIAERCNLSSSWASTLLKTVWEKGYLVRDVVVRKCGGMVFTYHFFDT